MTKTECETLVEYVLNAGRKMMECGAEAWRADNTMERILKAYGLEVLDAHTMATQTAVTAKAPDGTCCTATRSIRPNRTGTDLARLEAINATARAICEAPPPVSELPVLPKRSEPRWSWREFTGYLLGSGACAVFFGGSLLDGLLCSLIGIVIYFMERGRALFAQNRILYTLEACFLSGVLARLLTASLVCPVRLDMIMIGDIMLFIPGLALMNGVRELFYADILTGIYRVVEAVLGAGAIAVGYALSLLIGGGVL